MSFAISLLLLAQAAAVTPQTPPETPPEKKATVEGRVVKAGTGEPLKKARLTLFGAEPSTSSAAGSGYGATSDANGRYVIRDVEPGRYRLTAERNGYVRLAYGQRGFGPNRQGATLTLSEGQRMKDVDFRLIQGGAIVGKIVDEENEPLGRVSVQAVRFAYLQGGRRMLPMGSSSTNDLGEYRLFGLSPGRYLVRATPIGVPDYVPAPQELAGLAEEGYVPLFYQSTADAARATQIEVGSGTEVRGIDFILTQSKVVRVRGHVVDPQSSGPIRQAMVMLMRRGSSSFMFDMRGSVPVQANRGNTFELRGVAPGEYVIIAQVMRDRQLFVARQDLDVGSSNVENVVLTISPGVEIRGTARLEGTAKVDLSAVRIGLQPREMNPMASSGMAQVKEDGAFTFQSVGKDYFRVAVFAAPPDVYLKSARMGEDDVLENGLDMTRREVAGVLDLVFSQEGGKAEGVVLNDKNDPVSGATVVLVPDSRKRSQEHLFKSASTDQNGRFTLQSIPPGEYKLFAWEDVDQGAWFDPEFLKPHEEKGETCEVDARQATTKQLRVIPSIAR